MVIGTVVYFIAGLVAVGAKELLSLGGFAVSLILGTVGGGYLGYSTWGERRTNRR
jgi:hypothetical protein